MSTNGGNALPHNPFRIHGPALPPDLCDREAEVERVLRTLREPGAKLLVYGPRRMGKTSVIATAASRVEEADGAVILADFSTASSPADMTNRLLEGAGRALGRRWNDWLVALAARIGVRLSMGVDPLTGLPTAGLEVGARRAPEDEQRRTLAATLDALETMAEERDVGLGVVLDEFQEIHRFGGEEAEWHLRGVIQHHRRLSYVLAGSRTHLVERMLGKGRAFYQLLDLLHLGPIETRTLARWIEARLADAGIESRGAGRACVALVGPRTRDVVRLARATFDRSARTGPADSTTVAAAFDGLVRDEDEPHRTLWERLTPLQQNVLRAVAASDDGLTTAATMRRFDLTSSSAVSRIVGKFTEEGLLVSGGPAGYAFDDPFFRGWVVLRTLPDVGMEKPVTYRPGV